VPAVQTRLPVAPLLAAAFARHPDMTLEQTGQVLGVSDRTVLRWMTAGTLQFYSGDRAAVALGCHPCEVWGWGWFTIPDYQQEEDGDG